jgi:hypothetical protein
VIPFIEKTWFLWWVLANLLVLRWFHLFSSASQESLDASNEEPQRFLRARFSSDGQPVDGFEAERAR